MEGREAVLKKLDTRTMRKPFNFQGLSRRDLFSIEEKWPTFHKIAKAKEWGVFTFLPSYEEKPKPKGLQKKKGIENSLSSFEKHLQ